MRNLIAIIESAQHALLYHTTSAASAVDILTEGVIKPNEFVSFSEIPLIGADIRGNDVTIGFHPYAFWGKIEQVRYTEEWFLEHRQQAAYIAGEGWREQWFAPDDVYDDDGEQDEDAYDRAYEDAEFEAFFVKEHEQEWISRHERESMHFDREDVVVLIVKTDPNDWPSKLANIGYSNVKVITR